MSEELRNYATMHVDIPDDADPDEAEYVLEEIAKAALDIEIKGEWDPFVHWHRKACEDSDHCYGPGSKEEVRIRNQILDELIVKVQQRAREHVAAKRGHMTWAEVVVMLDRMKETDEDQD